MITLINKVIIIIPILLFYFAQDSFGADFSLWEGSGEAISRFGEEQVLKSAKEWTQWAQEKLLVRYYQSKGVLTVEKIHQEVQSDWNRAAKEETKSYFTIRFPLDGWEGCSFLSLTYSNLDFKEQAFGIHFDLNPGALNMNKVFKRYENQQSELIDEGNEKRYRYTVTPGQSQKNTPFAALQGQMIENDELWVDFQARSGGEVRYVEVLTVKANPYRVPFTKNWKWEE